MGDENLLPHPAPRIDWSGGTPVAEAFGDPYFSLQDGPGETRHTFLQGNDLYARRAPGLRVAELGFGTGLNALVTAAECPGLSYTAFEAFPMARDDMARALAAFPSLDAAPLLDQWPAERIALPGLDLTLIFGDARRTLPTWRGRADAWYLDGFAPARNPELWEPALLTEVARHTAPGGTVATYTAAGHVRRALAQAGFEVARVPGFGRKRHMTRGRLA